LGVHTKTSEVYKKRMEAVKSNGKDQYRGGYRGSSVAKRETVRVLRDKSTAGNGNAWREGEMEGWRLVKGRGVGTGWEKKKATFAKSHEEEQKLKTGDPGRSHENYPLTTLRNYHPKIRVAAALHPKLSTVPAKQAIFEKQTNSPSKGGGGERLQVSRDDARMGS